MKGRMSTGRLAGRPVFNDGSIKERKEGPVILNERIMIQERAGRAGQKREKQAS